MNLAKQMHILAENSRNSKVDVLIKKISDRIKTNAELGLYILEYEFKPLIQKTKLDEIEEHFKQEGFNTEVLDNGKYLYISWDSYND